MSTCDGARLETEPDNPAAPHDRSNWQVPAFDVAFWQGRLKDRCVIIPVINEGDRIIGLLQRMQSLGISGLADIIVVDGGSTDGSLETDRLRQLEVRSLLVKTGAGKLSAQLRCAYAFALDRGYLGIITIDGNNKDDPEAIPAFIRELDEGMDFVQASRFVPGGVAENTPRLREYAIRWVHAPMLSAFSGFHWTDTTQGFRAYSRRLLLDRRLSIFRDVFEAYELLAYLSLRAPQVGYRCRELPTKRSYPPTGHAPTKISGIKGNAKVLVTLVKACSGQFDPK